MINSKKPKDMFWLTYQETNVKDRENANVFDTDDTTDRCTSYHHETDPKPTVNFTASEEGGQGWEIYLFKIQLDYQQMGMHIMILYIV